MNRRSDDLTTTLLDKRPPHYYFNFEEKVESLGSYT